MGDMGDGGGEAGRCGGDGDAIWAGLRSQDEDRVEEEDDDLTCDVPTVLGIT